MVEKPKNCCFFHEKLHFKRTVRFNSASPSGDVVVVVLGFYAPSTAKVIQRRDLSLKSHLKDWRSPGSNLLPLVYKASSFTTTARRLLPSGETKWRNKVSDSKWEIKLTLKEPNTTKAIFANTADDDEMAHNEPSHLNLQCLLSSLCFFNIIQFLLKVFRNFAECFFGALRVKN